MPPGVGTRTSGVLAVPDRAPPVLRRERHVEHPRDRPPRLVHGRQPVRAAGDDLIADMIMDQRSPTPTSARTSAPAGNHPSSSTPTWNDGCKSSTPAARSPSPSAHRRANPARDPRRGRLTGRAHKTTALLSAQGMPGTWQERECLHVAGPDDPKCRWSSAEVPDLAQDRRGHQQQAFGMPQEAEACLAGVIVDVARSHQDARYRTAAPQRLSGRVPGRGSVPRVRPGPDRPQMRRRRAGLFPGRDPRPHACGSVRGLAAVRPPVAGPPGGAAPHASRSCIQCRPCRPPDGGRARCHGLAASPVSFLPGQAGSMHPPVAYRVARLPVSLVRRDRTRNGAGQPISGL